MDIFCSDIDGGKAFDWGRTSSDYAKYRDIYPPVFFDKVAEHGLCVRGQRVLDLGTGTGAIALALAAERPGTRLVAADVSADALALARENFALNFEKKGVPADVEFLRSDWFENVAGKFDAIVSNPPYLTRAEWECAEPEVREREPLSALIAENDGLADLEKILRGARERLAPGGFVALETGVAHHARLAEIARECGFSETESRADLSDRPRFFFAR